MKIKEMLKKELTKKELELLPTSFDLVGDVLIFNQFPDELIKKEKIIGNKLLENFKNVKVIAKKTGKYSGTYRTPKLKLMAGQRRKETIHKENGISLKLHPENVYFSARTSTERKRIYQLVRKGEEVLVMFSGIAPLPVVIAKNTDVKEVYGVEINPFGHKYALENIQLNKLKNVKLFLGDVRKVLPEIDKKFDRILMPLPKTAEEFLDVALTKIKKNGMIHLYSFISMEEVPSMKKKIHQICKENNQKCIIKDVVKCGQFSPQEYRMCFDIKCM